MMLPDGSESEVESAAVFLETLFRRDLVTKLENAVNSEIKIALENQRVEQTNATRERMAANIKVV